MSFSEKRAFNLSSHKRALLEALLEEKHLRLFIWPHGSA